MADRTTVRIRGLEVFGRHGVHDEERRLGQRFVVDLDLELSHCPGVDTDDLDGTVDYAALTAAIAGLVAGPPSRLLEHLAGRIADLALATPLAHAVTVTVDKPHVALPQTVAATGVRLHRRRLHTYWVGLGANLGDRPAALQRMTDAIAAHGIRVEAASPVYETAPQGIADQPPFLNAVLRVRTRHAPPRLLAMLKRLEVRQGRDQDGLRFGPRVIDADILLWDGGSWLDDRLAIPHPRLTERRFAMVPLLAVEPDAELPGGDRIASHDARLADVDQPVGRTDLVLRLPGRESSDPGATELD